MSKPLQLLRPIRGTCIDEFGQCAEVELYRIDERRGMLAVEGRGAFTVRWSIERTERQSPRITFRDMKKLDGIQDVFDVEFHFHASETKSWEVNRPSESGGLDTYQADLLTT